MASRFPTRIAHGARTPQTIAALEANRYYEEQLELEDFIASLNLNQSARVMPA